VDGVPVLYLERSARSIQTLPAFDDPAVADLALRAVRGMVGHGRERELRIGRIDGQPVAVSPARAALLAAGFSAGYRGLVLRDR
jgi:hypothetical protein